MIAQSVNPDAIAAIVGILAVLVVAVIRRMLTWDDRVRRLSERVAWLEAKVNGHVDRGSDG